MQIPGDLDDITTELVNAVDLANTDEDQSEENLNFVFNIIQSVANNCSDNVSSDSSEVDSLIIINLHNIIHLYFLVHF